MALAKDKKGRPYLTPNEVAELLMISPTTVRHLAKEGRLKSSVTPGGHRRFLKSDIDDFRRKNNLTPSKHDTMRVLIVDDDEAITDLLTRFLKQAETPVETRVTSSGFEAGRLVSSFRPDVVLLDLMMPGIDGYEVCRNIKEDPATEATRVIAVTGFYDEINVARVMRLGAETCLAKPFDFKTLKEAVGID